MRVAVCLKDKSKLKDLKSLLNNNGLKFVSRNPEVVISMGGDGTFLCCERKYPSVPKLLVRASLVCKKCIDSSESLIHSLKNKDFSLEEHFKLESVIKGKKYLAVNDFIIRNHDPTQALRFDLFVDGLRTHHDVIGDGIIVSSPFGSSAYYYSITGKKFKKGIGVAFNNATKNFKHLVLNDNQAVSMVILRGKAQVAFDNCRKVVVLKPGSEVIIKKSSFCAKTIKIKN